MHIANMQVGNSQLGQMMVKHAAEQGCTIVNMVSEAGGTMAMMTRLIKTMMMTFRARMITMMKMMIV